MSQLLDIITNLTKENEYLKEQIKTIKTEVSIFYANFFKSINNKTDTNDHNENDEIIEISLSNSIHAKDVISSIRFNFDKHYNNEHHNLVDYKKSFTIETTSFDYIPNYKKKTISLERIEINDNFFKSSTISKDTISETEQYDIDYKENIQVTADFIIDTLANNMNSQIFDLSKTKRLIEDLENMKGMIDAYDSSG